MEYNTLYYTKLSCNIDGKYMIECSHICGIYLGLDTQQYAFSCLNFSYQSIPVLSKRFFMQKVFKLPFKISFVIKFVFDVRW